MNKPKPVFYDSSLDTKVDWVVAMLEEMASTLEEMRAGTDAAVRAAVAAEREACAKTVEETEAQGDYSGMDEAGGSYWQSDAEGTKDEAARRIRSRP